MCGELEGLKELVKRRAWSGVKGKDHITDCYFCMINIKGINRKNKHYAQYPYVPSAIRPISHGPDLPVAEPDCNMEYSSDFEHRVMTVVAGDDTYKPEENDQSVSLTQAKHIDLTWDLLLGSHLKKKHLLAPGTMFYLYRNCERELRQLFM